jgi:hypothetical protein
MSGDANGAACYRLRVQLRGAPAVLIDAARPALELEGDGFRVAGQAFRWRDVVEVRLCREPLQSPA